MKPPKTLVVFGATGQQGGSVINFVLDHPELSSQYKIRAVTRVPSKPAAQALQERGVEVVKADLYDRESLDKALRGAHTVFGITCTIFDDSAYVKEYLQGKNLADAVVAAGAQYFIYGTVRHAGEVSGGKHSAVHAFDVKADIEKYIRTLPIKSAFFTPSVYMQDFHNFFFTPKRQEDGTYVIFQVVKPDSVFEFFDPASDTGKFVGAILAEPDKFAGKTLCAVSTFCSFSDVAEMISKSTGKTVKYKQVSLDEYDQIMPTSHSRIVANVMLFLEEHGYFGGLKKEVEWSTSCHHEKLTTFEEFIEKNPFHLE
ncbi:NmrA family transcriptional regulator [Lobosporangium transversale]|uniref:NmrA family transcriptional regulator n=1 Tax=Lobosporangium transversale TaxID=64571 RepID=A0A1Y2H089_9FUNG|nr:NmrA family transcriptional regulator [Lobosporangium transversale]ORZ27936.1 NmrA family transcriptional regulator [Lobosporangium transversale]|eukprot:XP_021885639.1 NmrA family transcriptional regulator [Lobosporangium transversale]